MKEESERFGEWNGTRTEFKEPTPNLLSRDCASFVFSESEFSSPKFGIVVGLLAGFDKTGVPLVQFEENEGKDPRPARSMIALSASQSGCEVVLMFERGDLGRPIIFGCIQSPCRQKPPRTVQLDGERLTLSADREIVLRCGKSSITLAQTGRVIIRGAYLLNHSSGVNRIRGGSVQIN